MPHLVKKAALVLVLRQSTSHGTGLSSSYHQSPVLADWMTKLIMQLVQDKSWRLIVTLVTVDLK